MPLTTSWDIFTQLLNDYTHLASKHANTTRNLNIELNVMQHSEARDCHDKIPILTQTDWLATSNDLNYKPKSKRSRKFCSLVQDWNHSILRICNLQNLISANTNIHWRHSPVVMKQSHNALIKSAIVSLAIKAPTPYKLEETSVKTVSVFCLWSADIN